MKSFTNVNKSMCIDLGTDFTSIYISGEGIVLREPSVIAYNINTNEMIASGIEAEEMEERSPVTIKTVRPIIGGVVVDIDAAGDLCAALLKKVMKNIVVKPKVMLSLSCELTEVEAKAAINSVIKAGARQVTVIDSTTASALGAGCDISIARGLMILDIGEGKSEIAAISICNTVIANKIQIAGNSFTEAIKAFIKRRYSIIIGNRTAKEIKEKIGVGDIEFFGSDSSTHLPRKARISSAELDGIFDESIKKIADMIRDTLDNVPPEILGDIMEDGILLTGGGAKLHGLCEKLRWKSGIKLYPADDIEFCNIKGCGIAIENLDSLPNIAQSYHNL